MNNEIFRCSVRYQKVNEYGLVKKTTENYLLEALSYTEAERRFIEEMTPFISGEYEVTNIVRTHVSGVLESKDNNADRWYLVKIAFITLDERSGEEKQTAQRLYIQAADFRGAITALDSFMQGTLGDWIILSIAEINVMDFFHYKQPQNSPVAE